MRNAPARKTIAQTSPLISPVSIKLGKSDRGSTPERLLDAAAAEFNESGFGGSDTNKIARRAGFAPQTFYRWFQDKVEIFVRVYERWTREEYGVIGALLARNTSDVRLAHAIVAHHKAHLIFRRSLRQLSVENDIVRAARARSRLHQLTHIKSFNLNDTRDAALLAATLFQTERLADAIAEGEFHDMGLSMEAGEAALACLIHILRTPDSCRRPDGKGTE